MYATGGDVRRSYDLFGLRVDGTTRYLNTIGHLDLIFGREREFQPGPTRHGES